MRGPLTGGAPKISTNGAAPTAQLAEGSACSYLNVEVLGRSEGEEEEKTGNETPKEEKEQRNDYLCNCGSYSSVGRRIGSDAGGPRSLYISTKRKCT